MSMPEVHTPTKAADPAAVDPMTTTNEGSADPIQSTGNDGLTPETRPEVAKSSEATATATDGVAATDSPGVAAPKDSAVAEVQPISEGILNYKAPGLVKSLFISKKFFWFSDEPLEQKHLSTYLSSEKADIAHRNAAHATQTGKGLLFFTKRAEDKDHPAGVLNLGELTDFVKGTFDEFHFKINGQKHTFQAPSRAERDSWVATIQAKATEAKSAHEGLVGSQGYKSQLEKFANPAGAASSTTAKSRSRSRPNKVTDSKTKESGATAAAVAGEEPARSGSSSDEAKTKSKTRSHSGKRSSIFGTLRAKKEEHDEKKEIKKEEKAEKKEEKAEEKVEKQEVKKEEKAEKKAEKEELKAEEKDVTKTTTTSEPLDAAGIAARVIGSPVEPAVASEPTNDTTGATHGETAATGSPVEPTATSLTEPATGTGIRESAPKSTKRSSIFGNFFNKKDTTSPASPSTETPPAIPAKEPDNATTSSTAPQIEDPVEASTENAATPVAAPEPSAPVLDSTATSAAPDNAKPARRSSFFNALGTKKERKTDATSDAEGTDGEGKKSSKFGGLFRKPSRAVPNGKPSTTPASNPGTEALKASVEPAVPISKDVPTAGDDTEVPAESATAAHTQTPVQATA
ncbi:MAG: hypothetical protein Q9195_002936 [Heterodermia aff. obscurata]